jgi:hypothetical protein
MPWYNTALLVINSDIVIFSIYFKLDDISSKCAHRHSNRSTIAVISLCIQYFHLHISFHVDLSADSHSCKHGKDRSFPQQEVHTGGGQGYNGVRNQSHAPPASYKFGVKCWLFYHIPCQAISEHMFRV